MYHKTKSDSYRIINAGFIKFLQIDGEFPQRLFSNSQQRLRQGRCAATV